MDILSVNWFLCTKISSFLRLFHVKMIYTFLQGCTYPKTWHRGGKDLLFLPQMYLLFFFSFLYISVQQNVTLVKFLLWIVSCEFQICWCFKGHFKEKEIPKEKLFPFESMSHLKKNHLAQEALFPCPKYFYNLMKPHWKKNPI